MGKRGPVCYEASRELDIQENRSGLGMTFAAQLFPLNVSDVVLVSLGRALNKVFMATASQMRWLTFGAAWLLLSE